MEFRRLSLCGETGEALPGASMSMTLVLSNRKLAGCDFQI